MKFAKTNPKTERRVMAIFWSIAAVIGLLFIFHLKSVHVESVKRIDKEDGAVVFVVDVVNPTRDLVHATLCLTTGTPGGDGVTAASSTHKHQCRVPAKDKVSTKIRFEPDQGIYLGGAYSAKVREVDVEN